MSQDPMIKQVNRLARVTKEWNNSLVDETQAVALDKAVESLQDFVEEFYSKVVLILPDLVECLDEKGMIPVFESIACAERIRYMSSYLKSFCVMLEALQKSGAPKTSEDRRKLLDFVFYSLHVTTLAYMYEGDTDKNRLQLESIRSIKDLLDKAFSAIEDNKTSTNDRPSTKLFGSNVGIMEEGQVIGFLRTGAVVSK